MFKKSQGTQKISKLYSGLNISKFVSVILGIIIFSQAGRIADGLTLLFGNAINFNSDLIKTIITQIGLTLITYTLIYSIFTVRQNREISKRVDDFAEKLGENIKKLQYSVGITQGALDTGLSAVKATRSDAIREIKGKMEEIINRCNENCDQKFVIKILGISLGDYLCPHGPLYHQFRDLISMENVKIQILILKDGSYSAIQRAKIEEYYVFKHNRKIIEQKVKESENYDCEKYKMDTFNPSLECNFSSVKSNINIDAIDCYSYLQTKCHNELRTATLYLYNLCNNKDKIEEDFIEKMKLENNNKHLSEDKKRERIEENIKSWQTKWDDIKSYDYAPLLLMIEFDDTMFVENYHLASRGGESPVLQIRKGTNLFRIYDDHFRMLYDDLGLSDLIDSCSCINKSCSKGAAIAGLIEAEKTH